MCNPNFIPIHNLHYVNWLCSDLIENQLKVRTEKFKAKLIFNNNLCMMQAYLYH